MAPSIHFILLILTLFSIRINGVVAEENGHEFDYGDDKKGPKNWGNLKPEWATCRTGHHQSPIHLNDKNLTVLSALGILRRTYKPAPALIKNKGHNIMAEWEGDAGGIIINGTIYALKQCHWHTPSEHQIDGKSLRMEIHLVHNNSRGEIAVIGILYKLGRPDPFLSKIQDKIKSATKHGTGLGLINPWEIKFGSRKYFRYTGSLTTPPCTEGVVWSILKKIRTVSKDQIQSLREAVDHGFENNARPVQDLYARTVYLFSQRICKLFFLRYLVFIMIPSDFGGSQ